MTISKFIHPAKDKIKDLRSYVLKSEQLFLSSYLLNKKAYNILNNLEANRGVLNKEIKAQCDEYAEYYLGSKRFSPWLYVYSSIRGEFIEGLMPKNYYIEHFGYDIDSIFINQGKMKPLTAKLLNTNKIPDLLYVNNGFFIEPENYRIVDNQTAYNLLFRNNSSVIFKSNNSLRGQGISFYTKGNFDTNKIKGKSGVFQKIIQQHPLFDSILPVPGATIRVVTALDNNGKASARSAYLRLGRLTDESTHVQSASNIKVAIDTKGRLSSLAYLPDWSVTEVHPDTNVNFSGLIIPSFSKACLEVESLHDRFPFISCIGWDLSINRHEKVEIMEWNTGDNAIEFHEAMHGPCFKDLIDRHRKPTK